MGAEAGEDLHVYACAEAAGEPKIVIVFATGVIVTASDDVQHRSAGAPLERDLNRPLGVLRDARAQLAENHSQYRFDAALGHAGGVESGGEFAARDLGRLQSRDSNFQRRAQRS